MTAGRTGCCPSCHGTHQLRIDGSLRRHPSARKRTCPGSGGTPTVGMRELVRREDGRRALVAAEILDARSLPGTVLRAWLTEGA